MLLRVLRHRTGIGILALATLRLAAQTDIALRPLPPSCPVLGDGLGRFHAGPAHWTFEGGARGASLGAMLSGLADFDGDGRGEWAFAATRFQVDGLDIGKLWVVGFTPQGRPEVKWSWLGSAPTSRAGSTLTAGDFNGDGCADLAVGSAFTRELGEILIFNGSRTNLPAEPSRRLVGHRSRVRFGSRLKACDVNRDGRDDLIVGALGVETQNRVLLYLGTIEGIAQTHAWMWEAAPGTRRIGNAFAVLDANGDSQPDLAVATPDYSTGPAMTHLGRVDLLLGTNGIFAEAPAWTVVGHKSGGRLGERLRSLGDLDNDGRDELSVGSGEVGPSSIYYGTSSGMGRAAAWTRTETAIDTTHRDHLRGVGDVNGDGWNDVLVWEFLSETTPGSRGLLQLFPGGAGGLAAQATWTAVMEQSEARLGRNAVALGDVNGDKLMDFAVASPNYAGASGTLLRSGRIDIFLGQRSGYGPGEIFPTDGINSQPRRETPPSELQRPQTSVAAVAPLPDRRSRRWWIWATVCALVCAVGAAVWIQARLRRTAASAVQLERERLARDLHDGLGSGVHRLMRLTERLTQADPGSEQALSLREDMARTAQELSGSLDRTLWAVAPGNDTLENVVSFLAAYAPSILEAHGIECELALATHLPAVPLAGEARQNLLLAVNEALQNVVKHAQARRAWLRVTAEEGSLLVSVEDNGRGLNPAAKTARGHGLRNVRARAAALGGDAEVTERPGGGTRVTLRLPMTSLGT